MRITKRISSISPVKCEMVARGFFGNYKGKVIWNWDAGEGYLVFVKYKNVGESLDFNAACNILLEELGVIKTVCV